MNIFLENVNFSSDSGPNHFANKLIKYMSIRGVSFSPTNTFTKKLTFIQTLGHRPDLDMFLRLDGIYFNSGFDCERMNNNIRRSYEKAKGVIFQTEFNRELVFKWFGERENTTVINNGADTLLIKNFTPVESIVLKTKRYNKIWSCAASWHSFKRLRENIHHFLDHSGPDDCLIVAGDNPDYVIEDPRVLYVGNLSIEELYTVYRVSDYFIHLAYLDHCPNVVIDARAFGCRIICSSSGGTKEIAGEDAIIIKEPEWDYSYLEDPNPPTLIRDDIGGNIYKSELSMVQTAKKYHNFLRSTT
jgi:glycosyltransferase involved in cell wall biosynthesis